ncbi:MAG: lamin tail domain-containing protein, partial [Verrucomicrobia bacterium]|nr:lamin tail domain-containing protein [Verrucomicrobiota bacterium]
DVADYLGTVINDPGIATNPPVLHWFTQDTAWESIGINQFNFYTWTQNPDAFGDVYLYFQGRFYAGARIRKRGSSTILSARPKFKIVMADSQPFVYANDRPPVREFNINRFVNEPTYMREVLARDAMEAADVPTFTSFHINFRKNDASSETASFVEQQDETFMERHGFDPDGAIYKPDPNQFTEPVKCSDLSFNEGTELEGVYNKESRGYEDFSDFDALRSGLALDSGSDALKRYMFDNLNIPQIINQMVVGIVIGHGDRCEKNFYLHRDSDDTGEWSMFPWDMDLLFLVNAITRGSIQETGFGTADVRSIFYGDRGDWPAYRAHSWLRWFYTSPSHNMKYTNSYNRLYDAIIHMPETREMYLRRLKTVTDRLLGPTAPGWLENRIDELDAVPLANINAGDLKTYASTRRNQLYSGFGGFTEYTNIPAAQTATPLLVFGVIEHSPLSGQQDHEYIELINTNAVAVDISGWLLSNAVSYVFQPGTVIPARTNMYVSPDVAAFRAREVSPRSNECHFVQGNYSGRLAPQGETIVLYDTNRFMVASITTTGAPPAVYTGTIRVTEMMVQPLNGDAEFVELYNTGPGTADLSGLRFVDGISFDFADAVPATLAAGSYALVVRDFAAFSNAYPGASGVPIIGVYAGGLNNGGERVELADTNLGTVVFSTIYQDARGWPKSAFGAGHSLIPLVLDDQAGGRLDYGRNWRPSTYRYGSPGMPDPTPFAGVMLNEVVAHTDYTNALKPEYDSNDRIELYNAGGQPQGLANWFLSDDDAQLDKWAIPPTNVVPALGWILFDEVTGFHSPITNGFGLNKDGETIYLSYLSGTTNDRVADCVRLKGQENGVARGRYGDGADFWYALTPTDAAANLSPSSHVVIAEIMFHPKPTGLHPEDNLHDEFIEILNPGSTAVDLWSSAGSWRMAGGANFTFPTNTTLAAGDHLLLVSFDPANVGLRDDFLNAYSLTNGIVSLMGPYAGR